MYSYEAEKPKLFTEEGQRGFLETRDRVNRLLTEAGAFRMDAAVFAAGSPSARDSWESLARVDRLVELGEIREVTAPGAVAGQHRVFVRAQG